MSLAPGSRVGSYEIVGPLGAGGMGEVYRGRDTRLHRDVAIKTLPDIFAADPERLARFEREAQVLASLNNPHIAQIYGVEHRALVMELVEGETLADRITRGPLPIGEAIAIAKQIADGLGAAHDVGIIHRDLKPANVRVRPDGTVKLLDFGLARVTEDAGRALSGSASLSPTITSPALATGLGTLLGTAVYMAPEQAKGRVADRRADVWAFGCVLYELLTGRRAFDGDGVTETLAAVLMKEPDWRALPAGTPRHVERLLQRCLRKDPRQRLQDIGDARLELDEPASDAPSATPVPAAARRAPALWGVGLVVVALAGIVAGRYLLAPPAAAARSVGFEIAMPTLESAVLSPDGSRLVIASQRRLFVRDLARVDLRALDGTDGAIRPFWSPDSATIVYGARGKLWKVAAAGGAPVAICDIGGGLWDDDAGGAWLADGTIVFSDGNTGMFQVSAQGGDPVEVLKPNPKEELHFHSVSGLPDGRGVLYAIHRGGTAQATDTISLWSDGRARVLVQMPGQEIENPVYAASGHILFERAPTSAGVWAVPFSAARGEVTGEPFLVAAGLRRPSASPDGTLVMLPPRRQRPVGLAMAGRDGAILSRIDEPRLRQTNAALSPDGARVAVTENADGRSDVWLYDLARGTRSRLTRDGSAAEATWAPDGRSVFYGVRSASRIGVQIKRVAADGSERTEDLVEGRVATTSRDGSTLFWVAQDKDGLHLWYRSMTAKDAKPALFIDQAFYSINPAPSPDGRFVAYSAATTPSQPDVYLRRFPPSDGVWQVSTNGGGLPRWSADGRLFFARGPDIFEVPITTTPEVRIGAPVRLFTRTAPAGASVPAPFDVTPDGKRFLIYEPAGDAGDERLSVTTNWVARFAR